MSHLFKIVNVFSKSPKILLMTGNSKVIGNCTYSIINKTDAVINNLYIEHEYRNSENGSKLLQYTESILKNNYSIEKTSLLAHEKVNCSLSNFFKKNGYYVSNTNYDMYDDGLNMFNLIPMHKRLKLH